MMTSYNAVNGTPSPADTYTVNELLQRTYGFNGYTTSDCGAIGDIYNNHQWTPPGWTSAWTNPATGQQVSASAGAQAYALRAGTDLNCTGSEPTVANIQAAINAGVLSEGVLDNALVHLFTLRMETGEFDPPSKVAYTKITKSVIQSPAHQALAEKVAADDLVLLKNDNVAGTSSPLLPADPAKLNNVVDRRQPGQHGHPGRLLRPTVTAGQRGAGHHRRGQGRQPERHGDLRLVRHLHDRDQPGLVHGGHPGGDQGRRPGHRVRRHRPERGQRGEGPDLTGDARQLQLADQPGERARQPADRAGHPVRRPRRHLRHPRRLPGDPFQRVQRRMPGHRAGPGAVRPGEPGRAPGLHLVQG